MRNIFNTSKLYSFSTIIVLLILHNCLILENCSSSKTLKTQDIQNSNSNNSSNTTNNSSVNSNQNSSNLKQVINSNTPSPDASSQNKNNLLKTTMGKINENHESSNLKKKLADTEPKTLIRKDSKPASKDSSLKKKDERLQLNNKNNTSNLDDKTSKSIVTEGATNCKLERSNKKSISPSIKEKIPEKEIKQEKAPENPSDDSNEQKEDIFTMLINILIDYIFTVNYYKQSFYKKILKENSLARSSPPSDLQLQRSFIEIDVKSIIPDNVLNPKGTGKEQDNDFANSYNINVVMHRKVTESMKNSFQNFISALIESNKEFNLSKLNLSQNKFKVDELTFDELIETKEYRLWELAEMAKINEQYKEFNINREFIRFQIELIYSNILYNAKYKKTWY